MLHCSKGYNVHNENIKSNTLLPLLPTQLEIKVMLIISLNLGRVNYDSTVNKK